MNDPVISSTLQAQIDAAISRTRPVIHRDHTAPQDQDEGRRRLRAGCALVALDIKRKGFDATGLRAEAMAHGHSERTLEGWARQRRKTIIVL